MNLTQLKAQRDKTVRRLHRALEAGYFDKAAELRSELLLLRTRLEDIKNKPTAPV
jgi:hypothetical protein